MVIFEVTALSILVFVGVGLLLSAMILLTKKRFVRTDPCKIYINDEESLTKETEGGKTLLAALAENGISVPSPCGGKATCKQCKVQVIEGSDDILETDKATFSHHLLSVGWRLSCQCKVKNDLKIRLPEALLDLKVFTGTVVSNHNVATFIKELIVKVPESEAFAYIPGDYLQFHIPSYQVKSSDWKEHMDSQFYEDWDQLGLFDHTISYHPEGEEVVRAYSMASYPGEGRVLKFNVRIASPPVHEGKLAKGVPWGIASSYIFGLKEGDQVTLSGPFGESHMIEDDRELIFLIGGAGSSFGRSHILDLFLEKNTQRKVTLWYGARSLKENIYQEEYETLAKERPNFDYRLVLSEPTEEDLRGGWNAEDPCKTNYLFKAFEEGQLKQMEEPEMCLYYVCGPPLHNESILKLLDDYGVPEENIVLDDFGS